MRRFTSLTAASIVLLFLLIGSARTVAQEDSSKPKPAAGTRLPIPGVPGDQDDRVQSFIDGPDGGPTKKLPSIEASADAPKPTTTSPGKRTAGNRPMIDAPPGKKIPFGE